MKCVLCSSVPNSHKSCPPPGHCCRFPEGQSEEQSAYKSPTGLHSYLQSQQCPQSCFTDPGLWVTEPSDPTQRHLGHVPRTATSSPHHARAQDPSPDDHKHDAVLCALSHCSEMHCQTPSAVK